jgi:tetratricopeptide (TPR) repeat protein
MMGIRTLVVLVLAAAPALAQPKTTPTPKEQAAELVKRAIAKSDAGDHQGAIQLYLDAYKLAPLHTLLSNVGTEYQKDGKPYDALRYFCMYLEKDPAGVNVNYATAKAKAIQIELGNKDVTDADVCKPKAAAAPPPPPPPPPPKTVVHKAPDPGRTMKLSGMAVGGVGVVAVGLGVVFGVKAQNATAIVNDHKMGDPWPNDILDIEKRGQRDENLQIGLLVGGGAALVLGGALYYVGHSKKSAETAVTVRPIATPTTAGIAIGGGF